MSIYMYTSPCHSAYLSTTLVTVPHQCIRVGSSSATKTDSHLTVSLGVSVSICIHTSPLHNAHLSSALLTDVRWLRTEFHFSRGCGAPLSSVASGANRGLSRFRSSSNLSHAGMVTEADMVDLQQQKRQAMARMIQQVPNKLHETVFGRIDMLNRRTCQQIQLASKPYRISDVIPTGKAASQGNNSDTSRHTSSYGCKRGLLKERRCWSALKALISTMSAHCQQIVRKSSSEPLRRRCAKYCTERQHTSH